MMTKSGRTIKPPSRLIEEMGVATSTMASVQNYYACLEEYDTDEVVLATEVVTNEESINGPDGEAWHADSMARMSLKGSSVRASMTAWRTQGGGKR